MIAPATIVTARRQSDVAAPPNNPLHADGAPSLAPDLGMAARRTPANPLGGRLDATWQTAEHQHVLPAKPSPLASDEVPVNRGMLPGVRAELRSETHEVKAGIARIEALLDAQNAQTRIVLDGITALLSRQNQVERRVAQVEDTVRKLAARPPAD